MRFRWFRVPRAKRARRRSSYQTTIERLEERTLLSATWNQLNGNAQHTGVSSATAQPLDQVLWSVPLDLEPWGSVHYGDPIFTSGNTVIVPIKVTWSAQNQNAQNFFIEGLNSVTGQVLWTSVPTGTITGAINAGPIVITSDNNGLVTGDSVTIGGVLGNTAADGTFTITYINANQFSLNGTTGNGAYSGGGTWVSNTGDSSFIEPTYSWIPPFQPVYDPVSNRVYFPGPGGTLDYIANPDNPGTPTVVQEAFYGNANYLANESAYNSSIFINTGLTVDSSGNVYFGFIETGTNPSGINDGGIVRISPTGVAAYTLAYSAIGQTNDGNWNPAMGASPAISNDGSTVYIGINDSGYSLNGNEFDSYLVGLNSSTLAPEYSTQLIDPSSGNGAGLIDESTSGPMVAPDGTVFQGVFGNPYNGSRGYLLHFSADLTTEFTPGAFGWDDTPSIVPTSMVPSYTGSSPYLILSKYNNYANADFGGPNSGDYGGNGVNEIAVLDPYSSVPDPNNDPNPNIQVMATVEAFASPSPDVPAVEAGDPDAVREWCTNGTVVDPATDSVFMNNEDGYTYEWNLATDTITNAVEVTTGIGVPYTPTAIAPNGEIFSDNGGTLFAEGGYSNYTLTTTSSANPAVVGNSITFTTTLASTDGGPTPTGSVTFSYTEGANNPFDSTPITIGSPVTLVDGVASIEVSGWDAAHYHVVASYSGDSNYSLGQSTLVQPVLETATTSVQASTNPIGDGDSVTFTATVAPNGSAFVPIGTVTFMDGSNVLGTASLNSLDNEENPPSDNTATFTTSNLPGGTDDITAVYSGDLNFTGNTSPIFYEYVPSVANPGTQNSAVGDSVSLQVEASGLASGDTWTYSASGLPTGLSINSSSGLITGIITGSAATYSATVTASDGQGDEPSQSFTWNVSTLSVLNPGTQNNAVGDSVSLQIQAGGLPSGDSWTYSASLPSGLSINASSGLITGTITGTASSFSASVTAGDCQGGSTTQDFTWNVSVLSVTNPGTQYSAVGKSVSLQVQASGLPSGDSWTYSATDLPSGLSINTSTGLISGKITGSPAAYSVSVGASDGEGASASQAFSWYVGATTTVVTSHENPSVYGQKVWFTATVTPVVTGSSKPSGTVTFMDGTTVLASVSLNSQETASYTTTAFALAVGGNSITATYAGNSDYAASTSTPLSQTVNEDPTNATVKSSASTAVVGQSVTLTATVTAKTPGSGTPTGTVTFFDGTTDLGPGTLNSSGQATFATSRLPLGSNSISVSYNSDGNYQSSSSSAITETINQTATKTVVASSDKSSVYGESVTFTATVTVTKPGSGTPTGTVTFKDGSTVLGPGTLNGAGQATYTTSTLAVGSHTITAVYEGSTDFASSTSAAITHTVNMAATTATVTSSQNPVPPNTPVTFTATVLPTAPGAGVPTGTVTFYEGSTVVGTETLNSNGQATFTMSWKVAGTHKIKVVYSGDADFDTVTSAALTETVT
jgi:hypothetical protein